MADLSTSPVEQPIFFDLLDVADPENMTFFAEKMSEEEEEEVAIVISQLEGVNSKELIDFATQETEHRHLVVDESELDRLASKNNAQTTNYQTKWAVTVFKGNLINFSSIILARKTINLARNGIISNAIKTFFTCFVVEKMRCQ